ncbi:MAG: transporter substrate-binding domain-containing protein [Candidatus Delongbacteria bacterium]|nr:transporter substrate-binding domain-containing protein [Candidatus Delongbacteria bacterium]MBN2835538.1 transporter substrate-binding domain-containing protein [Candidatus Delongbacteria bacterium]
MNKLTALTILLFLISCTNDNRMKIYTENYPPFNFMIGDSVCGTSTDILRLVMSDANIDYHLDMVDWSDSYEKTLNGKDIILYSMARTKDRENIFNWIGKVGTGRSLGFSKNNRVLTSSKPEIGIIKESNIHLKLVNDGIKFTESNFCENSERLVMALAIGKFDIICMDSITFDYNVRRLGYNLSDFIQDDRYSTEIVDYYIAASKKFDELNLRKIKRAYAKLDSLGRFENIRNKYSSNFDDGLVK